MILPALDFKISSYKTNNLDRKIHVLSNIQLTPNNLRNLNTHVISKKIILSSCTEKEYVIGFDVQEPELLKKYEKDPYKVSEVSVKDMLKYCKYNKTSLIVLLSDNVWLKQDPDSINTNLFYIRFRS